MRLWLMIVLSLFGAAGSVPAAAQVPVASATQIASAPSAVSEDYVLGVADKLRVLVFNEPTLSGEFVVGASGSLSLPLIGEVVANGRSVSTVREEIRSRLADGFMRDPRVSLEVLTFRPFYILGEVNKPGEYPYSNGLTVLNAVATAQGFTYRAQKKRVFIKHVGETDETRVKLNPDLKVQPGDTIRIGERYF